MNNAMWVVTVFGLLALLIFVFPPPEDENPDEDKN